jgi:Uma2 family endonuclease
MSTKLIFEEATFAMPTYAHGAVITNLGAALHAFDPDHRTGHSFGPQTTYPMVGEPPVREPDLTWVRADRLPADLNVDPDSPPDLAVEIVSRSDTHANTDARVRQYLASGVSMVWIIDPWLRTVIVYRPRAHSLILEEPDMLSGDPIIPGFAIPVAALFT